MTTTTGETLLAGAVEQLVMALVRQPRLPGDSLPGELSTFQSIVLTTLVDVGTMRLGALAHLVGTTDASASRNIDVLESLHLVDRTPDDSDGRGVLVTATDTGHAMVLARRARLTALVAKLVDRLGPDDGARFAQLLTELHQLLDGSTNPTGGPQPSTHSRQ